MATTGKTRKPTPLQEAAAATTTPERLAELATQDVKLGRAVAKNSAASPETLQTLASSGDEVTRKAVAANPSTPAEILARLATQFPEEVLKNPIFDLLLLENPNLLAELPLTSLRSLLKRKTIPVSFLSWASAHEDVGVQLAVALNPLTPAAAIKSLAASPYPNVREAAEQHINYADGDFDWQAAFWEGIGTSDLTQKKENIEPLLERDLIDSRVLPELAREFREELAGDSGTPAAVLQRFCQDPSQEVRAALLRNAALTAERLQALETDPSQEIREQVAQHAQTRKRPDSGNEYIRADIARTTTDQALLEQLSADWHWRVREAAAENPALKLQVDSPNEYARRRLAAQPELSEAEIRVLATDTDLEVQKAIARHPRTPEDLVVEFARRSDEDLRLAAAQHPTLPRDWCQRLAFDENWQVRQAVVLRDGLEPVLVRQMAYDRDSDVRRAVAMNPHLPLRELQMLDQDQDVSVRSAAMFNPARPLNEKTLQDIIRKDDWSAMRGIYEGLKHRQTLPVTLLRKLAGSDNWQIRQAVAGNPATPQDVMLELLKDGDSDVQNAVRSNPSCPAGMTREMPLERAGNPETPTAELDELAKDSDWRVRQAVAANPNTSGDVLKKLSQDSDSDVQRAAVENPRTDPECLVQLVNRQRTDWRTRQKLAVRPDLPVEVYLRLALDTDSDVRAAVAANPAASDEARSLASLSPSALLAADLSEEQWQHVLPTLDTERVKLAIRNPGFPASCLEKLLGHSDWRVRQQLARTLGQPGLLFVLLQDDACDVREAVSRNPSLSTLTVAQVQELWRAQPDRRTPGRFKKHSEEAAQFLRERPLLLQGLLPLLGECPWPWLRQLLAEQPDLSSEQLQQLLADPVASVREQAARHPGVVADISSPNEFLRAQAVATAELSLEQMEVLVQDESQTVRMALLGNPCLGDILRTRLVSEIPEKPSLQTWKQLLSLPVCPELLLERAVRHEDWQVRELAATSPSLTAEQCERLSRDSDSDVLAALLVNPAVFQISLAKLSRSRSWSVRRAVAAHPNLDEADLIRLLADDDSDVRRAALTNPQVTDAIICESLATSTEGDVSTLIDLAIARGIPIPAEQVQQFVDSRDWQVRRAIAHYPQLSETQLNKLLKDSDSDVGRAAMGNPLLGEESLRQHLTAKKGYRRSAAVQQLVQRNLLKLEDLLTLATDPDTDIRAAIASHPEATPDLLLQLAADGEEVVRSAVSQHPALTAEVWKLLAADKSEDIQKRMAEHPLCQRDAKLKNTFLRLRIAADPAATAEELTLMAAEKNVEIRTRVAAHPNTPAEVLAKLSLDSIEGVATTARANPNHQPDLEVPMLLAKLTAGTKPSFSRLLALLRPEVPVASLAKSFRSSSWLERCAIAQNPMTPDSTLQALLEDGNRVVRAAAYANLEQRVASV